MLRFARQHRPQRLLALAVLMLALLMQALWMPRMATAMAAGVDVCSAQGHRRIQLPDEDGQATAKNNHDCCCPGAWSAAPPPAVPTLASTPQSQLLAVAPQGAAPSLDWHAPLSRGPPLFLL
jgi:hypothetical protein